MLPTRQPAWPPGSPRDHLVRRAGAVAIVRDRPPWLGSSDWRAGGSLVRVAGDHRLRRPGAGLAVCSRRRRSRGGWRPRRPHHRPPGGSSPASRRHAGRAPQPVQLRRFRARRGARSAWSGRPRRSAGDPAPVGLDRRHMAAGRCLCRTRAERRQPRSADHRTPGSRVQRPSAAKRVIRSEVTRPVRLFTNEGGRGIRLTRRRRSSARNGRTGPCTTVRSGSRSSSALWTMPRPGPISESGIRRQRPVGRGTLLGFPPEVRKGTQGALGVANSDPGPGVDRHGAGPKVRDQLVEPRRRPHAGARVDQDIGAEVAGSASRWPAQRRRAGIRVRARQSLGDGQHGANIRGSPRIRARPRGLIPDR